MGVFDVPPLEFAPSPPQRSEADREQLPSEVVKLARRYSIAPGFDGNTWEYLQIWLPQRLLCVLTLGLYAPWATLRLKRYLWQRTAIAGRSFDIGFEPRRLLFGRIVLLAVWCGLLAFGFAFPTLYKYLPLAVFACLPWLLTRSYATRWAWLSLNGARFSATPTVRPIFCLFVWLALLWSAWRSGSTRWTTNPNSVLPPSLQSSPRCCSL